MSDFPEMFNIQLVEGGVFGGLQSALPEAQAKSYQITRAQASDSLTIYTSKETKTVPSADARDEVSELIAILKALSVPQRGDDVYGLGKALEFHSNDFMWSNKVQNAYIDEQGEKPSPEEIDKFKSAVALVEKIAA
ncbi:hypothetical protein BJ138DRAFT_1155918 [Hygrophoropsis aurantiaca]|uniref:Uncharacterized protein n=1 Tax=Hygrophoropsis aurantiaca TaxID=72124 RepID=A0ACB8A6P5_9AGAM|nr:hypothetical protein BJ138DRAFT_1155918 [Hygrophoropsis aurantiaca]